MRARAAGLLALSIPLLALALGAGADARPDASQAPWWGPGSPDDPGEGWHFRVPVTVENTRPHPIRSPTAQVPLDVGQLLVDAGWNAQSVGSRTFPTTFTLDEDSVRVIRYEPGFTGPASLEPLPARFYRSVFEADAASSYDASRNPAGTLVFGMEGDLAPGESRAYVVHLAAEEHGGQPAGPTEGLAGWANQGWGTTVHGLARTAQGRPDGIDVAARHEGTTATVFAFEGVTPKLADLPNHDNPLEVPTDGFERLRLPPRTFFKIEADQPVTVGSRGQVRDADPATYGGGAFVPSTTGDLVGEAFLVPGYAPQAYVFNAVPASTSIAVTGPDGSAQGELALSTARPYATVDLSVRRTETTHKRLEVTDGGPVLVQLAGPLLGSHTSIARGGDPLGTEHLFAAPPGSTLGLRAPDNATVRVLDAGSPGRQLYPFGSVDRTDPARLEAWPPGLEAPPGGANGSWPREHPARLISLERSQAPAGPVGLAAGPGDPHGHFPLDRRLATYTRGPVAVVGAHNATQVEVTEPLDDGSTATRTRTVHEDGIVVVEPDDDNPSARARLNLSKPATVLPVDDAETYADVLPAHGPTPQAEVGSLEFRGALVRLEAEDGVGGRSIRTVGPGQPAVFDLQVANVGDFEGRGLVEEVRLRCEQAPAGWELRGCGETFSLATDQSRAATVQIRPRDVEPGSRFVATVTAEATRWNVTDEVRIGVVVRESFDVDAWFFEEGGPKERLDVPFLVDEGGTRTVPVVVENTGTVEDTYRLDLQEAQEGWTLETLDGGEPATSITLDPGQARRLGLRMRADEDPRLAETGIQLEVVSTSNKLAFAKLRGRAQIATELNLTLDSPTPVQLVPPGQATAYPVRVANNGDGVVTVDLNASATLPDAWSHDLETREVTLFPGNATQLDVTVDVPAGEDAGERGTVRLEGRTQRQDASAPELVLTALVRHLHDLDGPSEPVPVSTGPSTTVTVPLVNQGNGDEEIRVLGLTPPWPFETAGVAEVPRNGTGTLPLSVDVPGQLEPGPRNLTLHLSLSRRTQRNLTVPLDVQATPRLEARALDPPPLLPGRSVPINLTVAATGNVPLEGNLTATLPPAWNATLSPARVELQPGESRPAVARIRAPADRSAEPVALAFRVGPDGAASEPFEVAVGRPDLGLSEASVGPRSEGGLIATARLANNGTVEARNATVGLVRDGQTLARTTVTRLAPGQAIPVAVGAPDLDDASGLELVADPEERFPDPNRDDNRVPLDDNPVPGPLAAPLAALAAAALARRRRSP